MDRIKRENHEENKLKDLYAWLIEHPEKNLVHIGEDEGKWRALTWEYAEVEE